MATRVRSSIYEKSLSVGETGIKSYLTVGEMGVGKLGICEEE